MGHKKVKSDTTQPKRQLIRTTIEKKKQIIAKYESGIDVTDTTLVQGAKNDDLDNSEK